MPSAARATGPIDTLASEATSFCHVAPSDARKRVEPLHTMNSVPVHTTEDESSSASLTMSHASPPSFE